MNRKANTYNKAVIPQVCFLGLIIFKEIEKWATWKINLKTKSTINIGEEILSFLVSNDVVMPLGKSEYQSWLFGSQKYFTVVRQGIKVNIEVSIIRCGKIFCCTWEIKASTWAVWLVSRHKDESTAGASRGTLNFSGLNIHNYVGNVDIFQLKLKQ